MPCLHKTKRRPDLSETNREEAVSGTEINQTKGKIQQKLIGAEAPTAIHKETGTKKR